jgi:hypothetical protein
MGYDAVMLGQRFPVAVPYFQKDCFELPDPADGTAVLRNNENNTASRHTNLNPRIILVGTQWTLLHVETHLDHRQAAGASKAKRSLLKTIPVAPAFQVQTDIRRCKQPTEA